MLRLIPPKIMHLILGITCAEEGLRELKKNFEFSERKKKTNIISNSINLPRKDHHRLPRKEHSSAAAA